MISLPCPPPHKKCWKVILEFRPILWGTNFNWSYDNTETEYKTTRKSTFSILLAKKEVSNSNKKDSIFFQRE